MLRSFFSALSGNKGVRSIASILPLENKVSKRFVAGITLEELILATVARNRLGIRVTVNYLGENVNTQEVLRSKALSTSCSMRLQSANSTPTSV